MKRTCEIRNAKLLSLAIAGLALGAALVVPRAAFGQIASYYTVGTTNIQTNIAWGGTLVNAPATPQSITLTNTGSATLSSIVITVTGGNTGDFGQSTIPATNCGGSLVAGASCTITATFSPNGVGARASSLSIANNAIGSPQVIALTGFGIANGAAEGTIPIVAEGCGKTAACAGVLETSPFLIFGSVPLVAGTATVSGFNPNFTSVNSFVCATDDITTASNGSKGVPVSASSITVTGTGTDVIVYECVGN